jgi:hypothetical protein
VPPEILATVESTERKRQEAIFETIINEMAYINDLKLIDEVIELNCYIVTYY